MSGTPATGDVPTRQANGSVAWEAPSGGGSIALPVNLGPNRFKIATSGETWIDTAGAAGVETLAASTDLNGAGLGLFVAETGGGTKVGAWGTFIELGDASFNPVVRITDPGAGGRIGFFGAPEVTQPAAPTTLADVIAALKVLGLVAT